MFDAISPRYDLMNRLMTIGRDQRWRRLAVAMADLRPGDRALDVATGTGDMAQALAAMVTPGGEVVGIDIAAGMLELARRKLRGLPVRLEQADVQQLQAHEEFAAATVAFGLRNFADRRAGLEAMIRALRPGGRLVVLELVPTQGPAKPLTMLCERRILPLLGRVVARNGAAYAYLPESIERSLTTPQMEALFRDCGLVDIRSRRLNLGTVAIVAGVKPHG